MRALRIAYLLPALLLAAGCGRKPAPRPAAKEKPPSLSEVTLDLGGSVIRLADPGGRWKFEARSQQVQASGVEGPYALAPAECRYQEVGKEPVLIRAARADIEKEAQRVRLQGAVQISSDGWTLEAERVEYDLKTGKVVAPGPTKVSFGRAESASSLREGGKGK